MYTLYTQHGPKVLGQASEKYYVTSCNLYVYVYVINYVVLRISPNMKYRTSLLKEKDDPLSASMVKKRFLKERCKKWLVGNNYHPSLFPRDSSKQFNISLKESVCKTNKTLALIAIDNLHFFHFAERLGINISERKNETTVVILDAAVSSVQYKQ